MTERVGSSRIQEITGFSLRKVQMLAGDGKIPSAVRLAGGNWSFDELKVRAWIREEESKLWRGTSTSEAKSGGRASKFEAANIDKAYEQLLGQRHESASRPR